MFKKWDKKYPSLKRPKSTVARIAFYSNQYAFIVQRLEKVFGTKGGSKSSRMAKLWQFWQGHPKPAFSKKRAKGGPREIFQKSPKNQPSLERPKSTLAQIAFYSNQYALLVQILEKILTQKTAPKAPEWPSYGNFCKITLNPHFLKKCKGGIKGNFSKIA